MSLDTASKLDIAGVNALVSRLRSPIIQEHLPLITQSERLVHRALHIKGDLKIEGDFDMMANEVQVLVVDGSLEVSGWFFDRADEENEGLVLVGGQFKVGNLVTGGNFEVHGGVEVAGSAFFMDNAMTAWVGGDLVAEHLYNIYHHVHVGGALRAQQAVCDELSRFEASNIDVGQVLDLFDVEAVATLAGEEDRVAELEEVDLAEVIDWLREGRVVTFTPYDEE